MCDYRRQRVGPGEAKQQKLERKRKDRLKEYLYDKTYLNLVTDYMWKVRERRFSTGIPCVIELHFIVLQRYCFPPPANEGKTLHQQKDDSLLY